MKFGEKLKKLIKARGIKAVTLAQMMGVSSAYISQLIVGVRKPGRKTLLKLSRALEVPLEYLLITEPDISDGIPMLRKIPLLEEVHIVAWENCTDREYPSLVATRFEYATTEDNDAFYITGEGLLLCCENFGMDKYDLLLIEPNKELLNGDLALVCCPKMMTIKKIMIKNNIIILMDEKQDITVMSKENKKESGEFYRISQCIKKL